MQGTTVNAKVSRVVDGDTIRVYLPGESEDESLRILALDTEESYSSGGKPVTPWGKEAKKEAESFFSPEDTVQLQFPGNESLEICKTKYRGNFGRLLVFVHKNNIDFQEHMISKGYSPYFTKYGNAQFEINHKKYIEAERLAQSEKRGLWDQLEVNGNIMRDYQSLGVWWKLRADIIDTYRRIKNNHDNLFNTRLDYSRILDLAHDGSNATIFTELRSIKKIGAYSALVIIGSIEQPFSLFIPNLESEEGQKIISLMETRYISKGETSPNRSYAYITGPLSLYQNTPQIVLHGISQITDDMPI